MERNKITEEIIRIFYVVYNNLGYGFMEKVYENAMIVEFENSGLTYKNQYPIKVYYKNNIVGEYIADFIIEDSIVVELKAIRELSKQDSNQLLNYLTATDKEIGLVLNYGKTPEIKRKIYDNHLKKYNPNKNKTA